MLKDEKETWLNNDLVSIYTAKVELEETGKKKATSNNVQLSSKIFIQKLSIYKQIIFLGLICILTTSFFAIIIIILAVSNSEL